MIYRLPISQVKLCGQFSGSWGLGDSQQLFILSNQESLANSGLQTASKFLPPYLRHTSKPNDASFCAFVKSFSRMPTSNTPSHFAPPKWLTRSRSRKHWGRYKYSGNIRLTALLFASSSHVTSPSSRITSPLSGLLALQQPSPSSVLSSTISPPARPVPPPSRGPHVLSMVMPGHPPALSQAPLDAALRRAPRHRPDETKIKDGRDDLGPLPDTPSPRRLRSVVALLLTASLHRLHSSSNPPTLPFLSTPSPVELHDADDHAKLGPLRQSVVPAGWPPPPTPHRPLPLVGRCLATTLISSALPTRYSAHPTSHSTPPTIDLRLVAAETQRPPSRLSVCPRTIDPCPVGGEDGDDRPQLTPPPPPTPLPPKDHDAKTKRCGRLGTPGSVARRVAPTPARHPTPTGNPIPHLEPSGTPRQPSTPANKAPTPTGADAPKAVPTIPPSAALLSSSAAALVSRRTDADQAHTPTGNDARKARHLPLLTFRFPHLLRRRSSPAVAILFLYPAFMAPDADKAPSPAWQPRLQGNLDSPSAPFTLRLVLFGYIIQLAGYALGNFTM
ncbi:hypothetical protein B0H13DRAFT_2663198 [Mycena leptocephala]|nr:hypothetical protein B0H13DRAFT_2663198 [Mycena leptocephala]